MELFNLRKEISDIDNVIMECLIKRNIIVKQIGELKKTNNIPVLDQKREDVIIKKIESQSSDIEYIKKIYEIILSESKLMQDSL